MCNEKKDQQTMPECFMVQLESGKPFALHFTRDNAERELEEWGGKGKIVPMCRCE